MPVNMETEADAAARVVSLEAALLDAWTEPAIRDWAIDGLPVWPLICHAFNTVAIEQILLGQRTLPGSASGRALLRLYSHIGEPVISRLSRRHRLDNWWRDGDIVFLATQSARDPESGLCRTTDAFRRHAEAGTAPLLYVDGASRPDQQDRRLTGQPERYIAADLAALRARARSPVAEVGALPGLENLAASLAPRSGIPASAFILWIGRLVGHMIVYHAWLSRLMDAARPSAIVLTDHGDALSGAFCAAASARNIPVACIQHGALRRTDPEHPRHPHHGFARATEPPNHWVWRRHNLQRGDVATGPSSLHLTVALGTESEIQKRDAGRPRILAAPQTPAQNDAVIAALKGRCRDVDLVWRPHPRFAGEGIPPDAAALGARHVSLDTGPLVESLIEADLVVTGYSAIVLEAELLGIRAHCVSGYANWLLDGQTADALVSFGERVDQDFIEQIRLHASAGNGPDRMARFRETFSGATQRAFNMLLS